MYFISKLWIKSSKVSKNSSSTPKSQSNECLLSVECDKSPPSLYNSSNFNISSSIPRKSEFVRVNGILKKIAITEEEVEGEGVIQVEAAKTGVNNRDNKKHTT